MAKFIAIRLLQFPLILAVIYLLTFWLVWVAPGDPFQNNDAGWKNAEYDRICQLARPETDLQKKFGLFARAEGILLDEAPIIPLYYYVNSYLLRPQVKGIRAHPRNLIAFKAVEVAR